ncbi:hypothetical protein ACROYT_G012826 [Oculina patagonica]
MPDSTHTRLARGDGRVHHKGEATERRRRTQRRGRRSGGGGDDKGEGGGGETPPNPGQDEASGGGRYTKRTILLRTSSTFPLRNSGKQNNAGIVANNYLPAPVLTVFNRYRKALPASHVL